METKKTLIEGILGKKPTSTQQTIANIIGGAIAGGGILAAMNNGQKTYEQATKGTQLAVSSLLPGMEARAAEEKKAFEADLAGYGERAVKGVESGLAARGITDTKVRGEAVSRTRTGLSGAYASARAALSRAKLSATTGLQSALAGYYSDVAQKQYASQMAKYGAQMGLWGALGGLGTSLLTAPTNPRPVKDTRTFSTSKKLNLGAY